MESGKWKGKVDLDLDLDLDWIVGFGGAGRVCGCYDGWMSGSGSVSES